MRAGGVNAWARMASHEQRRCCIHTSAFSLLLSLQDSATNRSLWLCVGVVHRVMENGLWRVSNDFSDGQHRSARPHKQFQTPNSPRSAMANRQTNDPPI